MREVKRERKSLAFFLKSIAQKKEPSRVKKSAAGDALFLPTTWRLDCGRYRGLAQAQNQKVNVRCGGDGGKPSPSGV